ncbi:hypothetical protein D3C74_91500 [compost metagenome]
MNNKLSESIQEMKRYAESIGYWPAKTDYNYHAKQNGFYTFQAIEYHTKRNWESYRLEFGIPKKRGNFTKDNAIEAMKLAAKEFGEGFNRKEYTEFSKDKNIPSSGQIRVMFGGWNDAREAAGFHDNITWGNRFTDEELLEAARQCNTVFPNFTDEEYREWQNKEIHPNIETIRRRFGSINVVKKKIGATEREAKSPPKFANGEWMAYLLSFISDQLAYSKYLAWSEKKEGAPSIRALRDNAGGYDIALRKAIENFKQK